MNTHKRFCTGRSCGLFKVVVHVDAETCVLCGGDLQALCHSEMHQRLDEIIDLMGVEL